MHSKFEILMGAKWAPHMTVSPGRSCQVSSAHASRPDKEAVAPKQRQW